MKVYIVWMQEREGMEGNDTFLHIFSTKYLAVDFCNRHNQSLRDRGAKRDLYYFTEEEIK